jgi:hypothetical protein
MYKRRKRLRYKYTKNIKKEKKGKKSWIQIQWKNESKRNEKDVKKAEGEVGRGTKKLMM